MILITIELHSAIDEHREVLSKIVIYNDASGNKNFGNYKYRIFNRRGVVYKKGSVTKYPRRLTVNHLLQRVLNDAYKDNK